MCLVECAEDEDDLCEAKFVEWRQCIKMEKEWRKMEEEAKHKAEEEMEAQYCT